MLLPGGLATPTLARCPYPPAADTTHKYANPGGATGPTLS